MYRMTCPNPTCGYRLKYSELHFGKKVRCQRCHHRFRLPATPLASNEARHDRPGEALDLPDEVLELPDDHPREGTVGTARIPDPHTEAEADDDSSIGSDVQNLHSPEDDPNTPIQLDSPELTPDPRSWAREAVGAPLERGWRGYRSVVKLMRIASGLSVLANSVVVVMLLILLLLMSKQGDVLFLVLLGLVALTASILTVCGCCLLIAWGWAVAAAPRWRFALLAGGVLCCCVLGSLFLLDHIDRVVSKSSMSRQSQVQSGGGAVGLQGYLGWAVLAHILHVSFLKGIAYRFAEWSLAARAETYRIAWFLSLLALVLTGMLADPSPGSTLAIVFVASVAAVDAGFRFWFWIIVGDVHDCVVEAVAFETYRSSRSALRTEQDASGNIPVPVERTPTVERTPRKLILAGVWMTVLVLTILGGILAYQHSDRRNKEQEVESQMTPIGAFENAEVKTMSGRPALLVRYKYNDITQFERYGNSGLGPWNRKDYYIIDGGGTKHFPEAIGLRGSDWMELVYDAQEQGRLPSPKVVDDVKYFYVQSLPMLFTTAPPSSDAKIITLLFSTVGEDSKNLRLGYKGSEISITVSAK